MSDASTEALERLSGGHFLEELADALAEVAEQVVDVGTRGTVTASFALTALEGQGQPGVVIATTIRQGMPAPPARSTVYYAHEGRLQTADPRQMRLPFRAVYAAEEIIRKTEEP